MSQQIKIEKPTDEKLKTMEVTSWPIWEKEVSKFDWYYDQQETCYILEGKVTVIPENADPVSIEAGDLVIFPQGMSCVWDITETIRKHYKFG